MQNYISSKVIFEGWLTVHRSWVNHDHMNFEESWQIQYHFIFFFWRHSLTSRRCDAITIKASDWGPSSETRNDNTYTFSLFSLRRHVHNKWIQTKTTILTSAGAFLLATIEFADYNPALTAITKRERAFHRGPHPSLVGYWFQPFNYTRWKIGIAPTPYITEM